MVNLNLLGSTKNSMGILGDIFNFADDVLSIPTDLLGLTNHHKKKEAIEWVEDVYNKGQISPDEYLKLMKYIENQ